MLPWGILEKELLTGTKEIRSGKCHEKMGVNTTGTQEIVGLIWIWDTCKREVISPKNSWRFFCKKGRKQFPKNWIWMWLWTQADAWIPDKLARTEGRRCSGGFPVACVTGPNPSHYTNVRALAGLPAPAILQVTHQTRMHEGKHFLIWILSCFSLLLTCQPHYIWD